MTQKKTLTKTSKTRKPEKVYSCRKYKTTCRSVRRPVDHTGSDCSSDQENVCALKHLVLQIQKTIDMTPDDKQKATAVRRWIKRLRGVANMQTIQDQVKRPAKTRK